MSQFFQFASLSLFLLQDAIWVCGKLWPLGEREATGVVGLCSSELADTCRGGWSAVSPDHLEEVHC